MITFATSVAVLMASLLLSAAMSLLVSLPLGFAEGRSEGEPLGPPVDPPATLVLYFPGDRFDDEIHAVVEVIAHQAPLEAIAAVSFPELVSEALPDLTVLPEAEGTYRLEVRLEYPEQPPRMRAVTGQIETVTFRLEPGERRLVKFTFPLGRAPEGRFLATAVLMHADEDEPSAASNSLAGSLRRSGRQLSQDGSP